MIALAWTTLLPKCPAVWHSYIYLPNCGNEAHVLLHVVRRRLRFPCFKLCFLRVIFNTKELTWNVTFHISLNGESRFGILVDSTIQEHCRLEFLLSMTFWAGFRQLFFDTGAWKKKEWPTEFRQPCQDILSLRSVCPKAGIATYCETKGFSSEVLSTDLQNRCISPCQVCLLVLSKRHGTACQPQLRL